MFGVPSRDDVRGLVVAAEAVEEGGAPLLVPGTTKEAEAGPQEGTRGNDRRDSARPERLLEAGRRSDIVSAVPAMSRTAKFGWHPARLQRFNEVRRGVREPGASSARLPRAL